MVLEQRGIHGARPAEPADKVDWDAVYANQLPRIYNYFRFRLGRETDVEDLTARTFEKAWSARSRYRRDLAGFSTWLFRIAQNVGTDRGDRMYTEIEQNALLIPQYLWSDPNPFVLVDFGFYRANQGQLAGSAIEGPEPSYATIADGSYPLARPIYLYVDQARIARSRDAYNAMDSLKSLGSRGSADSSFVELDDREYTEQRSRRMRKLSGSDLNNK
jgi:hypothetical protein